MSVVAAALPRPRPPAFNTLVFADEFNGPAGSAPSSANWTIETKTFSNEELQSYTNSAQNVQLDGESHLVLTARKESHEGKEYTSGRIAAKSFKTEEAARVSFLYGRLEARIKVPLGQGFWPAFWAVGTNDGSAGWPQCGEFDMLEIYGKPTVNQIGNIHGWQSSGEHKWQAQTTAPGTLWTPTKLSEAFHTYGAIWTPESVQLQIDGQTYAVKDRNITPVGVGAQWPFNAGVPFYPILDLAVGGTAVEPPNESTPFPSKMEVDWVRVYQ